MYKYAEIRSNVILYASHGVYNVIRFAFLVSYLVSELQQRRLQQVHEEFMKKAELFFSLLVAKGKKVCNPKQCLSWA
jgi:hypothetical protein